jgi:hypothetical protein
LLQHELKTDGSFQFWHTTNEGLLCAAKVKTSEFPVQARRRSQLAVLEVNNRKHDGIMLVLEELQNIEDKPSRLPDISQSIESRESDPLQNRRNDWQIR